jgi:predicted S18 family serine protease
LIPAGSKTGRPSGLEVIEVRTLAEAIGSAGISKPMKSGAFIEETRIPVS